MTFEEYWNTTHTRMKEPVTTIEVYANCKQVYDYQQAKIDLAIKALTEISSSMDYSYPHERHGKESWEAKTANETLEELRK